MDNNLNQGALFKNDKRENDRQPHYTGSINIGGKEYRLAAWVKTSQRGTTYMSLNASDFQPAQQSAAPAPAVSAPAAPASGTNVATVNDLPF